MSEKSTVKGYVRQDGTAVRSHERKRRSFRSAPQILPEEDGSLRARQNDAMRQMISEDELVPNPETIVEKRLRDINFAVDGVGWTQIGSNKEQEVFIGPNGQYDGLTLEESNFMGAQLVNSSFLATNLRGANLSQADLSHCDLGNTRLKKAWLKNASLVGANLMATELIHTNMEGVDLSDAILRNVFISGQTSFRGANWKGAVVKDIMIGSIPKDYGAARVWEQTTFHDAINHFGLSEKRFEYLVLSGAIEVRDNETLEIVKSDYDPARHHIPPWVMANFEAS